MKSVIVAVCIAFATGTSGHVTDIVGGIPPIPTAQSQLPAVVVTSDYYALPKVLVLHLFNGSGKDITGYTIITRHKNADGTIDKRSRGEQTSDMLSRLITSQMAKEPGASEHIRLENSGYAIFPADTGIFLAGATRDMTMTGIDSGSDLTLTAHTTNKMRMLSNACWLTGRGRCSR